jgi:alpha-glucosidase
MEPREVVGAREHRMRDGVLELTVDAGWQRLEVTGSNAADF